jgi:acyl transferase domain-containing protein/acyl carrier protein
MPGDAIAIVGMAGRFPGARDLEAFWRQIAKGQEVMQEFTDAELAAAGVAASERSHPLYVARGTVLEDCDLFDAAFFGYSPREAQVLDPQQRVFLECAWEAVEHAGYAVGALPESVGVFAGASLGTYLHAHVMRHPALAAAAGAYQLMLGNDKDYLCTRVSYKLGLRGPSMTVQTACSTSLVAVHVACRSLQQGECDMALAGGVSLVFPQRAGYRYQDGMILSPDGHCRPFDARAQGTRTGGGAGIVVLKRLSQALSDGDTIHAVIRGIAINNDGAMKAGYTAPSVDGQLEVIATAQALAGVNARSITYVEAHGTATPLGDPIEVAALTQAFRADTADTGFCRLGSLKAQIGHLDAAAGVAGLIKTVLALKHRELPPLVNFEKPNPALQLERSPFQLSAQKAVWSAPAGVPCRAGVSSFGIGGTNVHAVLEEAPEALKRADQRGPQLLIWSARTTSAADTAAQRLAEHLAAHPEQDLADVAFTLQVGREPFAERRALVVNERAQALVALSAKGSGQVIGARHEGGARPVAFLFSGQGSQHSGMGHGLYLHEAAYRRVVDRCAEELRPHLEADIRELMFDDALAGALQETRFAQPALFVTEVALATMWGAAGVCPAVMLGHSIGELVAAHLAGVMSLQDALKLVAARGRLMQQQPPGRMAAVHLSAADLPRWLVSGLEIAAINAPRLCTVSGPIDAIDALLVRLASRSVEARALQTSHAFHSAMMAPAQEAFARIVRTIPLAAPKLPFVSNVTGTWITAAEATSPAYWAEHLRHAVQFEAGMRTLAADPTLQFLEVGPGQALTSLARVNLDPDGSRRVVATMRRPSERRADEVVRLEAMARLWLGGVAVDWRALHTEMRRRVPLPTYPFERKRYWVDPPADAAESAVANLRPDALRRTSRIDEWFYAPTWSRDDGLADAAVGQGEHWLILGDEGPLSQALAGELRRRGVLTSLAYAGPALEAAGPRCWRVPPHPVEDLPRLLREVTAKPSSRLAGVIVLWSVAGVGPQLEPVQRYDLLVALGGSLPVSAGGTDAHLLHVTADAQSVLGERVRDPADALALGPALVLPTERPGLHTRLIDLHAGDLADASRSRAAGQLADEVQRRGMETQVALRAGRRWTRRYERIGLPAPGPAWKPLRRPGCVLITGGLGGMGLALARWLGTEHQAKLVLCSRSGLPAREQWDSWLSAHDPAQPQAVAIRTIRAIESAGGAVFVSAVDVTDESAMAVTLAMAREQFGAIVAVVHAAGVPGSGKIAERSDATDARSTFAPKVSGLTVLRRLLGEERLDWVALASSVSAVAGSPGTSDYAAANAVLDAFCDATGLPAAWERVMTINWGAWRDVGMAARVVVPEAMRARWAEHVSGGIAPQAGVAAFERALASGRRRVVIDTYDLLQWQELERQSASRSIEERTGGDDAAHATPATQELAPDTARAGSSRRPELSTPFVAPSTVSENRLAAIWEELLGIDGIGISDDFFELGGHSLMFARMLARIEETLGARMPLRDVVDAPTIQLLAARIQAIL